MLPPYEIVPGDSPAVVAYGATLPELFEHAALALFDMIFELEDVPPRHSRPIVAAGDTVDELLAAWLDELAAMSRAERLAPSYFTVDRLEEGGVQGSAAGMPLGSVRRRVPGIAGLQDGPLVVVEIPDGFWVGLDLVPARLRPV